MSLIPFNFNGSDIRVITDDQGEPWFVAKDIAEDLGYAWAGTITIAHVPEQWRGVRSVLTPSGTQQMAVLTEQGLYFFLGRSDKAGALPMQMWIAGDVLPAIRKTGGYQRPMTQAEMIAASANLLVSLERQQAEQQIGLDRIEQKVENMERFHVWDHRPSNCLSLTGIKAEMNKRYGLSGAVVDYVLKDWPHLPNPAGMVRNGHEEALGSQYMVWAKTVVTTAFKRFVSESTMETATQATHPYFEGRFRLVEKVKS